MSAVLHDHRSTTSTAFPLLLADLLEEQQDLSAVERFSQYHDRAGSAPREVYYRTLLPARAPIAGEQYAFEVDLDRCSGCKACVTACHNLNGLDGAETWRKVGLLHEQRKSLPVLQHVTTACHHCLEPGCLSACPTRAYEKDPVTGIVRHLDDQCFGCQYCVLACPYEVPQYHVGKGIVRKCDMCTQRLGAGEAPACVQSCPHEAIRISIVAADDVRRQSERGKFLPASPSPTHTFPTTVYRTTRYLADDLSSGDEDRARPEHVHWPLAVMLVLSQWSVGLVAAAWLSSDAILDRRLLVASTVLAIIASVAATLHMGRPWLAYRAILGWRTSWLSREIIVFGAYQGLVTTATSLAFEWQLSSAFPISLSALEFLAMAVGAAGIGCSIMIYAVTPRPYWSLRRTTARFLGTSLLLGSASAMTFASTANVDTEPKLLWLMSLTVAVALIALSMVPCRRQMNARWNLRTNTLLAEVLRPLVVVRWMLLGLGLIALTSTRALPGVGIAGPLIGLTLLIIGEFTERALFFAAASSPRMPGGAAS